MNNIIIIPNRNKNKLMHLKYYTLKTTGKPMSLQTICKIMNYKNLNSQKIFYDLFLAIIFISHLVGDQKLIVFFVFMTKGANEQSPTWWG